MSIRLAAGFAAAALLCACSGTRTEGTSGGPSAPPSAAVPVQGPMNSPVSRAGAPGQVPLDPAQRSEVLATAAKVPPAERARLRYALATGDDGRSHLVVYDGEGLDAGGQEAKKRHEYVVFRVINAAGGEHYDPQQNSIIAPIPPPAERDNVPTKP